ncbi:uncharacterized protein LOC143919944 isoform X2 [Arctopsyche grandis]|uniref:uncharacterized protein LOC143919944 isoform X2 n=1 Tax=Arctopsyche grandis TaxID=121162 RepID=UPI00406D7FAC
MNVEQSQQQQQQHTGELQRSFRVQDFATPGIITRERSFVRPQSHHHFHMKDPSKRRSMVVTTNTRGKPTMEIYRPPSMMSYGVQLNKLNVHAKEFTMAKQNEIFNSRSSVNIPNMPQGRSLHHSKSSGNVLHHMGLQHMTPGVIPPNQGPPLPSLYRTMQQHPVMPPLLTSASSGNILHSAPRVHFKLSPQQTNNGSAVSFEKKKYPAVNGQIFNGEKAKQGPRLQQPFVTGLKRSKSLTTTDTLASGMAALGLTAESMDLGAFPAEIQENLDKAVKDPNQLCARTLMELVGHVMRRAIESPRYALPAARHCVMIIEKEKNQTFLESLLNTCQQWYQDRDKLLNIMMGGGRPRLMAFISLLLELFCQLRRRCPQSATQATGSSVTPPARALLTLICKCCEECIRAPIPSASDTENLFFVLTYIGRDLETQLPGDLENLLAAVRDAFLNTAAAPSITKTLLQLIELHASHWQLPGGAVLYYYPTTK